MAVLCFLNPMASLHDRRAVVEAIPRAEPLRGFHVEDAKAIPGPGPLSEAETALVPPTAAQGVVFGGGLGADDERRPVHGKGAPAGEASQGGLLDGHRLKTAGRVAAVAPLIEVVPVEVAVQVHEGAVLQAPGGQEQLLEPSAPHQEAPMPPGLATGERRAQPGPGGSVGQYDVSQSSG